MAATRTIAPDTESVIGAIDEKAMAEPPQSKAGFGTLLVGHPEAAGSDLLLTTSQRVFSFGTKIDRAFQIIGAIAAIGAGAGEHSFFSLVFNRVDLITCSTPFNDSYIWTACQRLYSIPGSQRDHAVHAPHYLLKDLARLDNRLEAHLDGGVVL